VSDAPQPMMAIEINVMLNPSTMLRACSVKHFADHH